MLYRYVKAKTNISSVVNTTSIYLIDWSLINKLIPPVFIVIGLFLISLVIYPLLSYKINLLHWHKDNYVSPIPDMALAESKGYIAPVSSDYSPENNQNVQVINDINYELINNWFPSVNMKSPENSKVKYYNLSIPKLKINQAVVTIGGKELGESLIQYPGTALPGEYGTTIIFGHSVLPTFYNPKDYKTIFSLIPTLRKGDEIILEFDGMKFKYLVENYFEAKPEEVDVLQQRFDRQMLRLITCVPPGTYLRRGIIEAKLQNI